MVKLIGTEQGLGFAMRQAVKAPGTTSAGTTIALPEGYYPADELLAAIHFKGSDGTAAALASVLIVDAKGTAAPAAGHIALLDDNNFRMGDATTTRDLVHLTLRYKSFRMEV